jgi:hypothetical protein
MIKAVATHMLCVHAGIIIAIVVMHIPEEPKPIVVNTQEPVGVRWVDITSDTDAGQVVFNTGTRKAVFVLDDGTVFHFTSLKHLRSWQQIDEYLVATLN